MCSGAGAVCDFGLEQTIKMLCRISQIKRPLFDPRFDNAETLKSWVLDIRNEALNLRIGEEEQQNWWSATFDKVM